MKNKKNADTIKRGEKTSQNILHLPTNPAKTKVDIVQFQ